MLMNLLLEWITINLVTNDVYNCGVMSYWTSNEETGFILSSDVCNNIHMCDV